MKLDELHMAYLRFRPVRHGYAVSGGNLRIGSKIIHLSRTSRCKNGSPGRYFQYPVIFQVHDVCAIALRIFSRPCNFFAKMVLGNQVYSKMVLQYIYIIERPDFLYKRPLDLVSRHIPVMKNTLCRVCTFHPKLILSVGIFVEPNSHIYNLTEPLGAFLNNNFYDLLITEPVTCNQCVFPVLFKIIIQKICNHGYTALGILCITLDENIFGDNSD